MNAVLSSLASIGSASEQALVAIGLFNLNPLGDTVDVQTIAFIIGILWALFMGLILGFWRGRSMSEPPEIQWPVGHPLYKPGVFQRRDWRDR